MHAMLLDGPKKLLRLAQVPKPHPSRGQILIHVQTCGICRTDLHIVDGELESSQVPLILGHQIVGFVEGQGEETGRFKKGDRVGVPWLGHSCGKCRFCSAKKENLCEHALYTGYHLNGGFAEYCVADEEFCFPIPSSYASIDVAPLLCGGLIGYRAYRMAGHARNLGLYGFGSSAHLLIQVANHQGRECWVFTRPGDREAQELARKLGAVWAGSSDQLPEVPLDAAIVFAPVGSLVPQALRAVDKGGKVICAGIYMSEIPSFSYALLYGEKVLCSVMNLTRQDGNEFFQISENIHIHSQVTVYPLEKANEALEDLRQGRFSGSAVLNIH
jgi:propanol-preferring alcohol dehydrogenase